MEPFPIISMTIISRKIKTLNEINLPFKKRKKHTIETKQDLNTTSPCYVEKKIQLTTKK